MNELYDLLETSRGPEARQREGAPEVSVFLILSGVCYSVWRKNSQNNGYFSKLRECAFEDRAAIEASRSDASKIASIAKRCDRRSQSDVIEDRGAIEASQSDAPGDRSIAKRCSRGIADDDAPGVKGRSPPPARHHRAIADAPRGIILLTPRVSIYLYFYFSETRGMEIFLIALSLSVLGQSIYSLLPLAKNDCTRVGFKSKVSYEEQASSRPRRDDCAAEGGVSCRGQRVVYFLAS